MEKRLEKRGAYKSSNWLKNAKRFYWGTGKDGKGHIACGRGKVTGGQGANGIDK